MKIRVDKCSTFGIQKHSTKSIQYKPKLLINNKHVPRIEIGESFRYLGRYFDFNMSDEKHKSESYELFSNTISKIDELPLHPQNKILLYSRYLLSKISWGGRRKRSKRTCILWGNISSFTSSTWPWSVRTRFSNAFWRRAWGHSCSWKTRAGPFCSGVIRKRLWSSQATFHSHGRDDSACEDAGGALSAGWHGGTVPLTSTSIHMQDQVIPWKLDLDMKCHEDHVIFKRLAQSSLWQLVSMRVKKHSLQQILRAKAKKGTWFRRWVAAFKLWFWFTMMWNAISTPSFGRCAGLISYAPSNQCWVGFKSAFPSHNCFGVALTRRLAWSIMSARGMEWCNGNNSAVEVNRTSVVSFSPLCWGGWTPKWCPWGLNAVISMHMASKRWKTFSNHTWIRLVE